MFDRFDHDHFSTSYVPPQSTFYSVLWCLLSRVRFASVIPLTPRHPSVTCSQLHSKIEDAAKSFDGHHPHHYSSSHLSSSHNCSYGLPSNSAEDCKEFAAHYMANWSVPTLQVQWYCLMSSSHRALVHSLLPLTRLGCPAMPLLVRKGCLPVAARRATLSAIRQQCVRFCISCPPPLDSHLDYQGDGGDWVWSFKPPPDHYLCVKLLII